MAILALLLAVASSASGLCAAYKWLKASRVNFVAFEEIGSRVEELPTNNVQVWINALRRTLRESGRINAIAARWTAASVGMAALSALAGLWSFLN